jgi:hypothetical protein
MAEILGPQRLGPLTPLVGEWEGNVGVDLSYHNEDDLTGETGYFEKAWFRPIPKQENGKQSLEGLTYQMTAWRHGEEAMNPFHDEVGYLLWEKATGEIMRAVVFGRGIAALAGGTRMHATRSSPCAPRRGHRPMAWCRTNTAAARRDQGLRHHLQGARRRHLQLRVRPAAQARRNGRRDAPHGSQHAAPGQVSQPRHTRPCVAGP